MKNIYIHIPFCKKKCFYCDFPIFAIGKNKDNMSYFTNKIELEYVDYLLREVNYFFRKYNTINNNIETIYFGGGTPSLLSQESLLRIIDTINKYNNIKNIKEFTIEVEPDTINEKKISFYKSIGINRVSMGVQSVNNYILKKNNRTHTKEDIKNALLLLKESSITYSIDLILGLPFDHILNFEYSLNKILEYQVNHISAYIFTLEKNSYFGKIGDINKIYSDNIIDYYNILIDNLVNKNRYEQYEISNFAKFKEFKGIHNKMYWKNNINFFGFGVGAAYLNNNIRYYNPKTLKKYYEYIDSNFNNRYLNIEYENYNIKNRLENYLMGNLRTSDGLNFKEIKDIFYYYKNNKYNEIINKIIYYFINEVDHNYFMLDNNKLTLTNIGYLNNMSILRDLFIILDNSNLLINEFN